MDEIDKAWQKHFELCTKLEAMRKQEKVAKKKPDPYAFKKVRRELLPDNMHSLFVQLNCIEEYVHKICKRYEETQDVLESATYIVDFGNIGEKRSRQTFPQNFEGAKQYFDYIKGHCDWAELLMSVGINYNERYIEEWRARRAN